MPVADGRPSTSSAGGIGARSASIGSRLAGGTPFRLELTGRSMANDLEQRDLLIGIRHREHHPIGSGQTMGKLEELTGLSGGSDVCIRRRRSYRLDD
jgi:hypothetical protein